MSQGKNIFVFLGPPGSGKGSLSHLCEKEFGWKRLSTGDLCRKSIIEKTKIGQEIDFALKSGKLVRDEVVGSMVFSWIDLNLNNLENIILDGYPRAVSQAIILSNFIQQKLDNVTLKVVRLALSKNRLFERLFARLICLDKDCQAVYSSLANSLFQPKKAMQCDFCKGSLGKRSDDDEATVQERLSVYDMHERLLLDFYKDEGQQIFDLNVEGSPEDVFGEFQKLMGVKNV